MSKTTDMDLMWATSGKKPMTFTIWSGGYRLVGKKQEGLKLVQTWKRWHERQGWTVLGTQDAYRAYPPGAVVGVMSQASHCYVETFHRHGDSWSTTKPPKAQVQ